MSYDVNKDVLKQRNNWYEVPGTISMNVAETGDTLTVRIERHVVYYKQSLGTGSVKLASK